MNEYSKLIKDEITTFIILLFIYIIILPFKSINKNYIIFTITILLSSIVISKIYYSKYKLINYRSIFTISAFISLLLTGIKDFFNVKTHYFALFIVILFIPFYFFSIRPELSKINEELNNTEE